MISGIYLLLWAYCAVGEADHVVVLPDWGSCEALASMFQAEGFTAKCRSPEWATIMADDDGCGYGW